MDQQPKKKKKKFVGWVGTFISTYESCMVK